MASPQKNNPLHGQTLEMILRHLVDHYGWKEMGERIRIKCFTHDPSVISSLKFLRKTPWARLKVEKLYLESLRGRKQDTGEGRMRIEEEGKTRREGTRKKR